MARIPSARIAGQGSLLELPAPMLDSAISLERSLAMRRSVRHYGSEPLAVAEIGQLLWAAQGITQSDGSRTAPSAGGLHPLKAYLFAERVEKLDPGLYVYVPSGHRLRWIGQGSRIGELVSATWEQDWVSGAAAVLALTGDDERVSEHYGTRARRYVDLEAGHAIENAHLQATALGLCAAVVGAFDDLELARRLGCEQRERPLCLLVVGRC